MAEQKYPWDIQLKEGAKPYRAFRIYLELGQDRSYEATAKEYGCHPSLINAWGLKFGWVERARLYDNYIASEKDNKRLDTLVEFQSKVARDELEDYNMMRQMWLEQVQSSLDNGMTPKEFTQLIQTREQLSKLGRRRAKMPVTYQAPKIEEEKQEGVYVLQPNTPSLFIPDKTETRDEDEE